MINKEARRIREKNYIKEKEGIIPFNEVERGTVLKMHMEKITIGEHFFFLFFVHMILPRCQR